MVRKNQVPKFIFFLIFLMYGVNFLAIFTPFCGRIWPPVTAAKSVARQPTLPACLVMRDVPDND